MTSYRAADHQLFDPTDRLLLGGPMAELSAFAVALNAARPRGDAALRAMLLDLIEGTQDCSFAPFIPLTEEAAADLAEARADLRREDARRRGAVTAAAQGRLF